MKKNNNTIYNLLEDHNLKKTSGRIALLNMLQESSKPLSIDQIKTHLSSNITTIYRMLEVFVEKGIVYQTDFRDGKAYFELQDKHHHHVTCTKCGTREDIDICIAKKISPLEKQLKQFRNIKSHMLEFFGVCNKCEK
jgi:Fe2+ or Zn2+ uptake regulation protein